MQILERVYDFKSYLVDCSRLLRLSGRMVLGALVYWWRYGAHCDYRCFAHFGFGKRMEDFGFGILDFRPCGGFFAMLGQAFMVKKGSVANLQPASSIEFSCGWMAG